MSPKHLQKYFLTYFSTLKKQFFFKNSTIIYKPQQPVLATLRSTIAQLLKEKGTVAGGST